MSNAGIPLRIIQEISGHRNLEQLQIYLEVETSQVRGAMATLSILTPVVSNNSSSQVINNIKNKLVTDT